MVGQYVARIYDEARARPLYLVREARGFAASRPSPPDTLWPVANHDAAPSRQAPGQAPGRLATQRVPPLPPS